MTDKKGSDIDNSLEMDGLACEVECIHPEVIEQFSTKIIDVNRAKDLAELFKTLGDPTRIRIMDALALGEGELCVCDLAELLDLSQSATSHQLRVLRNSKLIKYRREGKMIYYSLDDDHVSGLYSQGLEHISEK